MSLFLRHEDFQNFEQDILSSIFIVLGYLGMYINWLIDWLISAFQRFGNDSAIQG